MADIVYRFPEMDSAAAQVEDYAKQYSTAAGALKDSIDSSTSNWEGDSKNKFSGFLASVVSDYLQKSIPDMVNVIAEEIKASSKNMSDTDAEIARNIPASIG